MAERLSLGTNLTGNFFPQSRPPITGVSRCVDFHFGAGVALTRDSALFSLSLRLSRSLLFLSPLDQTGILRGTVRTNEFSVSSRSFSSSHSLSVPLSLLFPLSSTPQPHSFFSTPHLFSPQENKKDALTLIFFLFSPFLFYYFKICFLFLDP